MKKIELTKSEKELIRLCKGSHRFKKNLSIQELIAKYYDKIYGMSHGDYKGWKYTVFNKLFTTYMKIRENGSGEDRDIINIFIASFNRSFMRNQHEPIERAIAELYGQIQCTAVRKNGKKRFNLY